MYLSKAKLLEEITEPLNNKTCLYYSLLTDGSSSAKTMDEKELVLIKTCLNGSPKFTVLALEEPEPGDADGLKKALDHAYGKGNFSFERKHREVGLCTDGTSTNKKVHRMEKEAIGDWFVSVLCLNHKVELPIHDAFKISISEAAEKQLIDAYYNGVYLNSSLLFLV